jgi:Skp family chaperone for outer membrane proteins
VTAGQKYVAFTSCVREVICLLTVDAQWYRGNLTQATPSIAVDNALARVNRSAAANAADSEWQREKKRLEDKFRASEEQNRALRKMLNDQNLKRAADQESPFEQGGRA